MTLTRYQPWGLLDQLQRELSRGCENNQTNDSVETDQWTPAVDIKEETDCYVLHADIPGVKPDDIEISMEDGILTVKGERETEAKSQENGYTKVERSFGSFYRRFTLPDTADPDSISATSIDGVLELSIPKRELAKPKKIKVSIN